MPEGGRSAGEVTWKLLAGPAFWDFWFGMAVGFCRVPALEPVGVQGPIFSSTGTGEGRA
ncbi:hypothetical protein BCF44_12845 [Kutzneria buriramensis]|uniref:Uncharacterized protein n=1 Tax=Kutzneria buriramensis TaxID=1045776 RepID=A0A3E0GUH8_9PSEU|nr:hypothetical protein BCF44_12845 [Kutzneria buriramensis]